MAWYANLNQKNAIEFKDDKRHGKSTTWYENGQKEMEGDFKDGKKHGKHTYWYENGKKWSESEYKDDKKHGKRTYWYENGQKKAVGEFKDGKEHGKSIAWHANGKKLFEVEYKDGTAVKEIFVDPNMGAVEKTFNSALEKSNGLLEKLDTEDEDSDELKKLKTKLKEATTLAKEEFSQGNAPCPEGFTRVGNAPPKGFKLVCRKNGQPADVKVTAWHKNGQKKAEGELKNGKVHGKFLGWHPDGKKAFEFEFKDGKVTKQVFVNSDEETLMKTLKELMDKPQQQEFSEKLNEVHKPSKKQSN